MTGLFRRFFYKSKYVFVIRQSKVLNDEAEKSIRKEISSFIKKNINGWFRKNTIVYSDMYTDPQTLLTYSVYATCEPKSNGLILALMYEIFAYCKTDDEGVFSFSFLEETFGDTSNEKKVLKFKVN